MSRNVSSDGLPVEFHSLPKEKYPVRIILFGPKGNQVFDSGVISGPAAIKVPGWGPGSVRYTVCTYGDGTSEFRDDPTYGRGMDKILEEGGMSFEELYGRMQALLDICKSTGRTMIEDASKFLEAFNDPIVTKYFSKHAEIGELMLQAVDQTEKLFEASK